MFTRSERTAAMCGFLIAGSVAVAQPGRYRWEEVPTFLSSGIRMGYALDNAGRVVGFQSAEAVSNPPVLTFISAGFTWEPGDLRKAQSLGPGLASTALATCDAGTVVGYASPAPGQSRAAILSESAPPVLIPTLGGSQNYAHAVNDLGVVVGNSATSGGSTHAFRWDPVNGSIDLGTLGGSQSNAESINQAGWIVGKSTLANGTSRVFLYPPGGPMVDLNAFLPGGSPWLFVLGVSINESGRVAGNGTLAGISRAFTFDPGDPQSVQELVPLVDHSTTSVKAMNNLGWCAGYSTQVVGRLETIRAAIWKNGDAVDISSRVVNRIVNYYDSAMDINDAGQVLVIGPPSGASHNMTSIHRLTPLCDADIDANGYLNGDDFDAFMQAFDGGDALADFDENGWVNGDDFDAFTLAWDLATGCP